MAGVTDRSFAFDFDRRVRLPLALLGVTPRTTGVRLRPDRLVIRYGPFRLATALTNVIEARITGPYELWRSAGPRLSGRDSGITFGTSAGPGVCLLFRERVRVLYPHEACTITVAEPAAFVAHWRSLTAR
jgi:hypothetical protein